MLENTRKNLLIVTLHADPAMPPGVGEWGGTHTYMRELLTELYDKDLNIILITRKVYANQQDIEIVSPFCKILRLTIGEFCEFDKKRLFELHEETLKATVQALEEMNFIPDIIHSVYWNSGHLALKLSQMWNIPYVHSVISNGRGRNFHGAKGTAPNRIETEEKVYSGASFIICVAQSEKEELSKYYNISPNKIVVAGQYVHPAFIFAAHDSYGLPRKSGIHYKIESSYFPDYSPTENTISNWWSSKNFTYTGRMSLDKGIHYIVQAWYILYQKYDALCPALWLIGGNAYDIEKIRLHLGIPQEVLCHLESSGKIVWWGYLDENGISAIYTRSLALVTHSLYEPGGRVAVEAMCEGLPVLATPNGFALDAIRDWYNGFLIPYGDVETLALRMEHFIKQPYITTVLGKHAEKISNIILKNWDFTDTHLAVYDAALMNKITFTKNTYEYDFEDTIQRKVCTYPYNQLLIDKTDILQIMEGNGINDVTSIEEIKLSESSSMFWQVSTQSKEYYIKIPYDRINLLTLWSPPNEQPFVISGLKRYIAEIGASSFEEIAPIFGKDDKRHAIIREKYSATDIHVDLMLDMAINKILSFYQNNTFEDSYEIEKYINEAINNHASYADIDQMYIDLSSKQFIWQNYFMDYSLRVELLRWKTYCKNLTGTVREEVMKLFEMSYDILWEIASNENTSNFTINHGGCDFKNLVFIPEAILLDNEKLHLGWPGIDFSDLLISYVRFLNITETYELWDILLSKVPRSIVPKEILIAWIILGTYKEAVSDAAYLKPICQNLFKRIEILLRFLT